MNKLNKDDLKKLRKTIRRKVKIKKIFKI